MFSSMEAFHRSARLRASPRSQQHCADSSMNVTQLRVTQLVCEWAAVEPRLSLTRSGLGASPVSCLRQKKSSSGFSFYNFNQKGFVWCLKCLLQEGGDGMKEKSRFIHFRFNCHLTHLKRKIFRGLPVRSQIPVSTPTRFNCLLSTQINFIRSTQTWGPSLLGGP